MTYFQKDNFTTNEVTGAIASAMLNDLRVNNFAFQGFPSIIAKDVGETFDVFLTLGDKTIGPMSVPFEAAKAFARAFQNKQRIEGDWFKRIQGLLVDLEVACSDRNRSLLPPIVTNHPPTDTTGKGGMGSPWRPAWRAAVR